MQYRIAETFSDSLSKLTGEEQKAVKTTAFDLQIDPTRPSMQLHRIDRARDRNFWSVRVSNDIRIIVHRTDNSLLLCYVAHHDDAYRWAQRRRLERHPRTGAAQLVEIRETVRQIEVPKYVAKVQPVPRKPPLFANVSDDELLRYGVPAEWIADTKEATEDTIFALADHLPAEAAEALLELATGGTPEVPAAIAASDDPFEHPDAKRRFRVMGNVEELERALEAPWEKWTVFLHPAQRELVEKTYSGPARVSGSAGTGKTIVALHRAVYQARIKPDARVLLATFSEALANALRRRLNLLISNQPRIAERLEVHSMSSIGRRLHDINLGRPKLATLARQREILYAASAAAPEHRFTPNFLWTEWSGVVDDWQLRTWEEYRDVQRLGRKTRLAEGQRKVLWGIFETVRTRLTKAGLTTEADMFSRVAEHLAGVRHPPFDHAVIDEAQDIGVAELRFLAALGGDRPDGLFFAGDLGQRIFQLPFSWKALGVDVRGRSTNLRINYRTSHQIRSQADRLLGPELADVDGNTENRRGTVSVFNGPAPVVQLFDNQEKEANSVGDWIKSCMGDGVEPHEIALFVRSPAELLRADSAVKSAGAKSVTLDEGLEPRRGSVSVGTMHLAKGLEFRAVGVMACDDEVVPLQERIEQVTDDSDLDDVFQTERHLLYVACTRARDQLLVTGLRPGSEFLRDIAN